MTITTNSADEKGRWVNFKKGYKKNQHLHSLDKILKTNETKENGKRGKLQTFLRKSYISYPCNRC